MTNGSEDNLKQIIRISQPHYHKDFPLILFWSPKSGCTSLVKWFFFQIGLLSKAITYHPWVHIYEFHVYKKQANYQGEVLEQILRAEKDVFKLVRNPYKRAVSSFLFFIEFKERVFLKELEEIRHLFHNDINIYNGISFQQFLYYLMTLGPDINKINRHLVPQYIEGEEELVKDYIWVEDFNQRISEIEETYGLVKSPLETITESYHHLSRRMVLEGNYSGTAFGGLTDPLPTYQSFYDDETMDLVKVIFKKDFQVYGYRDTGL